MQPFATILLVQKTDKEWVSVVARRAATIAGQR